MRRPAAVVGACLLGAACATGALPKSDASSDLGLLEAVYRHQMGQNASSKPRFSPLYCLRHIVGGQVADPPPELLERFGGGPSKVLPASACQKAGDADGAIIVDPVSRLEGLILIIGDIRCDRPVRCTVEGGYYEANQSASGNTYTAERRAGRWIVTDDRLDLIT
jgi:hypothetical protein